jgi:predicted glutamine amidotransferase
LHAELSGLNKLGQLNCLLSDGQRLFCYHDQAGYKGLTFRKVHMHDGESRQFGDAVLHIDLAEGTVNQGVVVATCPLSANGWQGFLPGELIVLMNGAVGFSSHRRRDDAVFHLHESTDQRK